MKNLILILAFMFLPFALMAQDKTISVGGLAGVTNTTSVVKAAAYSYVYKMNAAVPYLYTYSIVLDDNTGSNTASVVFAGSLDNDEYKTIETIAYAGAGSDTAIIGNITSAPLTYKYLKWTVTPSDTIWIKSIWMNIIPNIK